MEEGSGYSAAWSSAFDWGSKGPEFKSPYPDHFFLFSTIQSFVAGFFCVLILPKELQTFPSNHRPNREQIENGKFSLNRCVLNKVAANSLFGKVGGRL